MEKDSQGIPGGPVVRALHAHCQGPGSVPGQGTKIPQAAWHDQKEKEKGQKLEDSHLIQICREATVIQTARIGTSMAASMEKRGGTKGTTANGLDQGAYRWGAVKRLTGGDGQLDIHTQKGKDPRTITSTTHETMNSKWVLHLQVKPGTIKILQENRIKSLWPWGRQTPHTSLL